MPYEFVERIKENDLNGSDVSDSQQTEQRERRKQQQLPLIGIHISYPHSMRTASAA